MSSSDFQTGGGGPGCIGIQFLEYCKQNNLKPTEVIPKVDVKLKLYRVSEFDQKRGTINVTFILMMDWNDPSLSIAENTNSPDFAQHFWPKPDIINVTNDSPDPPDLSCYPPKYKPCDQQNDKNNFGVHRATVTIKYQCIVYVTPNYSEFPFDSQTLEISLKLLGMRIPGEKGGTRPQVCGPTRWRWEEGGHEMTRDCDCLPEFSIVRLVGKSYSSKHGPFPYENLIGEDRKVWEMEQKKYGTQWSSKNYIDQYTLQIIVSRNSTSVMWNMCFSLFVIDCLVFSAHGIPIDDLGGRLGVNLTLLLTAMAFKWVLSDKLPDVPYLTTMEKYAIMTFLMLFLQGLMFWFLAELSNYRCISNTYIDWITGDIRLANSTNINKMFDVTCKQIHIGDRVVLLIECSLMILKNLWFLVKLSRRNMKKLRKEKNFVNIVAIDEDYSRVVSKMTWRPNRPADTDGGNRDGGSKIVPSSQGKE